jgi:hypothetical protein
VALPSVLVAVVLEHLAEFSTSDPEDLIFKGPKGAALRRNNFHRSARWAECVAEAGLPEGFLFAGGAAERIIVASLPRNRAAMHLDTVFTFCGPETVTAFTRVTDTIVPFSLRPDDATSSGLDIRR